MSERESWRFIDIMPDSYDENSVGPRRDIQDIVSLVMSHHEKNMMEFDSVEEDEAHNMHDKTFWESHLEFHIELVMMEDKHPPLGSVVDEEYTDV